MNAEELKVIWKKEEAMAHIHGWDFTHIHGRYEEENDLPWNYEKVVRQHIRSNFDMLDYDTGGGEFLLSLGHPYSRTSATEGYKPNVDLCREKLLPLGINFRACNKPSEIPYDDNTFDMIINRHGDFNAMELYRLLKNDGIFITQQVGGDNDRDLVEMVLPGTEKSFPYLNLKEQCKVFENAGFHIIKAEEVFRPIRFYDVGAFVWFAHIIEWEFPGFSVENCFSQLLEMQKMIDETGKIEGTIHRYLMVARK